MDILLAVPHGFCVEEAEVRMCDTSALRCAKKIAARLLELGMRPHVVSNNRPRSDCDENRFSPCSEQSEFRQEITEFMRAGAFVLDVHSFSLETGLESFEAYVIDDDGATDHSIAFVKFLRSHGVRSALFQGEGNAVHVLARRQFKLKAFLLEISEFMSEKREDEVCEIVAKGIVAVI